MWYFSIYFKSLCRLTFKYPTASIKNSLLLALLTRQILWKEQILTETTFTKSSSDKVSNISMTDVRISFNVNPLTLPLLKKFHNRKVEFSKCYVKHGNKAHPSALLPTFTLRFSVYLLSSPTRH